MNNIASRVRRIGWTACLGIAALSLLPAVRGDEKQLGVRSASADLAALAETKDWAQVVQMLDTGADPNAAQADGMTALHWAVAHSSEPTVQRLLSAKADCNATTRYGITPLSIACTLDNENIVSALLERGAKVDVPQAGDATLLMLAARTGNPRIVEALLEADANFDAQDSTGQTALMWAAAHGNADAADVLLNAGADPNVQLESGFTALTFAARQGQQAVANRLLRAGVDVNFAMAPKKSGKRAPRKGTSALLMAVESGHFELAMFLVQNGADPNDQRSGYAPLHVMSWVRKPSRGEDPDGDPPPRGSGSLTSLDFVKAIVDSGADVNLRLTKGKGGKAVLNHDGATPFLLASKTCDLPLLRLLRELGADPLITNVDGTTALMAAAGIGVRAVGEEAGTEPEVIDAISFLADIGLDVNAVDANKETAMHGAAYRNFPLVVEHLAALGARSKTWNHKNAWGWTPVAIAEGNRPGSFKPSPVTVQALEKAMSP